MAYDFLRTEVFASQTIVSFLLYLEMEISNDHFRRTTETSVPNLATILNASPKIKHIARQTFWRKKKAIKIPADAISSFEVDSPEVHMRTLCMHIDSTRVKPKTTQRAEALSDIAAPTVQR